MLEDGTKQSLPHRLTLTRLPSLTLVRVLWLCASRVPSCRPTAAFVQRAHARTPVAWSLGEDTVLGMWVHQTPFAITALHWGWDTGTPHTVTVPRALPTSASVHSPHSPSVHDAYACYRWDKIHDLCFKCTDKTQLWKPITTSTVVVHIKGHQAGKWNFDNVHANLSQRCDSECMQTVLPFDVPNLADLCGRNVGIKRGYSKCELV